MEIIDTPKQHLNLRALDDLQLVQQAVEGEKKACTALFDRYRSSVFQFICRRTPDPADAHDLAMEAFGKAFMKLHTFVPNYAFSTWLFKIAHNHCIDFSRRRRLEQAHRATFDEVALSNRPDELLNPEESMIRQERIAMVFSLLQQLNPRYRRMIELRFYEELSYEEIAEKLNLPIGTVKAQLFRAKEMMRHLLESPRARA